jgi:hypothetical protein
MSTVARSVFHAELDAVFKACEEIHFLRQLLSEISVFPGPPTPVYTDNTSVISYCCKESFTDRARLVDHKYLFCRELVSSGSISVCYVSSTSNPADSLTKPTNKPRFVLHSTLMGIVSP